MSNKVITKPTKESGLYKKGYLHKDGGIAVLVDGVNPIEVEVKEYKICREAFDKAIGGTKVYNFINKTNLEVLDAIFQENDCVFETSKAKSNDFIICRLGVLDPKKYNRKGTAREIINQIQSEKGCRVSNSDDSDFEFGGQIPERYKQMGFKSVGEKKKSNLPEKKWMVLAKKGNQYKVVHGGFKGMQDFSQHKDEERRERFWSRMGGINSDKAKDPFSPLYWHKKFGTWEDGGQIDSCKDTESLSNDLSCDHKEALEFCNKKGLTNKDVVKFWSKALHHFKEEEEKAFPEMLKKYPESESEIDGLLATHEVFYQLIEDIKKRNSKNLSKEFCDLLKEHIHIEDKVFEKYPIAEDNVEFSFGGNVGLKNNNETKLGTFVDSEGEVRFEIDDSDSMIDDNIFWEAIQILKEDNSKPITYKLPLILNSWEGYRYYPETNNIDVIFHNEINKPYNLDYIAMFSTFDNKLKIYVNTKKLEKDYERWREYTEKRGSGGEGVGNIEPRNYMLRLGRRKLLHELQHCIQKLEGRTDYQSSYKSCLIIWHKKEGLKDESLVDFENRKKVELGKDWFSAQIYYIHRNIKTEKEAYLTESRIDYTLEQRESEPVYFKNGGSVIGAINGIDQLTLFLEEKIKKETNYLTSVNYSETEFGKSNYIYVRLSSSDYDMANPIKVRISDHSVTNFGRMFNEIHVHFSKFNTGGDKHLQYVINQLRFRLERDKYFDKKDSLESNTVEIEVPENNLQEQDEILSQRESSGRRGASRIIYKVKRKFTKPVSKWYFKESGKMYFENGGEIENNNKSNNNDILKPIPQGINREKNEGDRRNEEVASELRTRIRKAQEDLGGIEKIGEDTRQIDNNVAYQFAKEKGIWLDDLYYLGEPFGGGNENTNVLDRNKGIIFKSNNLSNSKFSLINFFDKIEIHNSLFPETAYSFVGFNGHVFANKPYVEPIYSQSFIKNAVGASEKEITEYMENLGFEKLSNHRFKRGNIEVYDLLERNVLKDINRNIYVVDAEFKVLGEYKNGGSIIINKTGDGAYRLNMEPLYYKSGEKVILTPLETAEAMKFGGVKMSVIQRETGLTFDSFLNNWVKK